MEKGIKIVVIVLFTVFILAINIPNAIATHVACGANLTISTMLDSNLNCATSPALTIARDNIELNCRDFTIRDIGRITNNSKGISAVNKTKITVRNCNVRNFTTGFYLIGTRNSRFINNSATSPGLYGQIPFNPIPLAKRNKIFFHAFSITNLSAIVPLNTSKSGSSFNNTFKNNIATNYTDGFFLRGSFNNTLFNNTVKWTYEGIYYK